MKILEQALKKINNIHKKQKDFLIILIQSLIGSVGKKNMRNLARYAQITEHTFARQMAKVFDFVALNFEMIKDYILDSDLLIAAQDTSFISKSGKCTPGLAWRWNSGEKKSEKGLELDVIATIKIGQKKDEAFTLSSEQINENPTQKSKEKKKESSEQNRIDLALAHVKKVITKLFEFGIKHMVADAFYAKTKYVNGVIALGLHVITKIRKDSRFLELYNGPQKARGRKRKTTNIKITNEHFSESKVVKLEEDEVELRDCIAYSVAFGRKIKIISVKKIMDKKEAEVFLCSTDLELDALQIYQFYTARFQIEFIFRDAKGYTGLQDCQSRDSKRIHYHFNASLTALNFARLQDIQNQKIAQTQHPFSMLNLARQYHVEIMLNQIFCMLGLELTSIKLHPDFQKALAFGNVMY